MITARDNYFMAAVHWGGSQWTFDENNEQNIFLNQKKRACYANYARLADHRVEPVWIPFQDTALPAWYHLPPDYTEGRMPAVVSLPGMDSFKEMQRRALRRSLAQSRHCRARGGRAGPVRSAAAQAFASAWRIGSRRRRRFMTGSRPGPRSTRQRIGVAGNSFGSFFGTILVANESRYRACAVSATCLEPGCHTIFEEASPTFKKRFMWMAGYTDETKFDDFVKTMTWEGHVEKIRCPYLCLAGEAEELSPLVHTEVLFAKLKAPEAPHRLSGCSPRHCRRARGQSRAQPRPFTSPIG